MDADMDFCIRLVTDRKDKKVAAKNNTQKITLAETMISGYNDIRK